MSHACIFIFLLVLSCSHMETVRKYSQVSPEERILNNHYSDLMRMADLPCVAVLLTQCGVVDPLLVYKLKPLGMNYLAQRAAIIRAVSISVRINPSCFPVVLSILEAMVELAPLAERMRRELKLSELTIMLM